MVISIRVVGSGAWLGGLPSEKGVAFCIDSSVEYRGGPLPVRPLGAGDKEHGYLRSSSEPKRHGDLTVDIVAVLLDEAVSAGDVLGRKTVPLPNGRMVKAPAGHLKALHAGAKGDAVLAFRLPS